MRNKEEVEALVVLTVLNEVGVDDTTWWWVLNGLAISALDEHSLVDSLVDNHESDGRDASQLVVNRFESFLELRDFLQNNLVSHSFSNSISVDDDLAWEVSAVLL